VVVVAVVVGLALLALIITAALAVQDESFFVMLILLLRQHLQPVHQQSPWLAVIGFITGQVQGALHFESLC
jgi:hypothetical protein